jgi:PAS domain S-box-containing protein
MTAINEEVMEAREEVIRANESLEQRVAERTSALQESEEETQALNEELSALIEELAASNEELVTTNEELADSERRLQGLVEELRQADERSAKLAAIVETSDDAIIGKTLDGIVTSWNQGAERMYGYPESEMLGTSILKTIPEDRQHEEPAIIASIKAGNKVDHYVTKRLTHDGRLIDVSLTISPILNKAGQVIGVSKIARDISEQKQQEQRKSDFIGMASHELKTPLTSLTALLQVLDQKLRDSPDRFIPAALSKANRQTQKMISLINGFLNVSRLESGKLVMDKQPVDLIGVIQEDIAEMELVVSSHSFIFEPAGPVTVSADREKIGSVVSNLLSNAVKYSPKGRVITIRCRAENGEALISVQDEGMGVKPNDLPRLFDRYYRAAANTPGTFPALASACISVPRLSNNTMAASGQKVKRAWARPFISRCPWRAKKPSMGSFVYNTSEDHGKQNRQL